MIGGDRILSSFVEKFSDSYELSSLTAELQFEHFVNHCLMTRDYSGSIDLDGVSTGSTFGIDGAALFVNDFLVESKEEIAGLSKGRINSRFVLTQAKTSSGLDIGEFLKFMKAVESAFDGSLQTDEMQSWLDAKESLYKQAFKFDRNPKLELYYCYTGRYSKNDLFESTITSYVTIFNDSRLFSDVSISIIDADGLKYLFRDISNKLTRTINFQRHASLPKMEGVKRAYLGILPCNEYLKLLTDEEGRLVRRLFYDNVRDYQGDNPVNKEIIGTLKNDPHGRERFGLMNNGVTIVAKSINPVGDEFTIRDYQVVNGCQTSHILYNNRSILSGNEFITVKLIETEDSDLANRITKATNRQTQVTLEAFASLQPFHKELESYFEAVDVAQRLYYERRPGQFDWDVVSERNRIISVPQQIKAFLSVMLEEPHKVHFYYGQLLNEYSQGNSALFIEGHDPAPYYMSSWLAYLTAFRFGNLPKVWRYHQALAMRVLAGGRFNLEKMFDSNYCGKYCGSVLTALRSDDSARKLASKAAEILLEVSKDFDKSERDKPQIRELSRKLVERCLQTYDNGKVVAKVEKRAIGEQIFIGKIDSVSVEDGVGFIAYGLSKIYFSLSFKQPELVLGASVKFKLRQVFDGTEAFDVVLH